MAASPYPRLNMARNRLILAWLAYIGVILYGSFIPFELRLDSLEEAWQAFLGIRFLDLSVVSRADWVANIILYVPLSFLGARWLSLTPLGRRPGLVMGLVIAFGLALALAVEFLQTFFAPRTVSINDLIAESIGTVLGALIWRRAGDRLARLWHRVRLRGATALWAALGLYALAYAFMTLFPFDFLISLEELRWKLSGDSVALLLTPCDNPAYCLASLGLEILAAMPLGVLAAGWLRRHEIAPGPWQWLVYGLLLGALLETLQLMLASGVAQGVSVLMRGLGFFLGAAFLRREELLRLRRLVPLARSFLLAVLPLYLLVLAYLNHWFQAQSLAPAELLEKWRQVRLMPFFYHYFTSEPVALRSVLNHLALYAPVGAGYWLWRRGWQISPGMSQVLQAGIMAAGLALVMETGKLWAPGKHPDYTDVLIAAAAAMLVMVGLDWAWRRLEGGGSGEMPAEPVAPAPVAAAGTVTARPPRLARFLALGWGVLALYAWLDFPVARGPLLLGLLAYAVLLWCRPGLWLLVLPALLPVLNLAPWSGRVYLDAFDLFLLVSLALLYGRVSWPAGLARRVWRTYRLWFLLLASYGVSAVIGLLPWRLPDINTFYDYYSPYNGLRLLKPVVALTLLLPFLHLDRERGEPVMRRLITGILLGLLGLSVKILWERLAFVGLLDFNTPFRVDGGLLEMHAGSGYVEAVLALALPLLVAWLIHERATWRRVLGLLVLVLGIYGLLVTFSRGGYLGFALALLLLFGSMGGRRFGVGTLRWAVPAVVLLGGMVAYPVLSGSFAQARLGSVPQDMAARLAHWRQSLGMMQPEALAFGMGLGSFPRNYLQAGGAENMPGTYRYVMQDDRVVLRLGSGSPSIYLDQRIARPAGRDYRIVARLRGFGGEAVLSVFLCEKNVLYSLRCRSHRLAVGQGQWREVEAEGRWFADEAGWPRPPLVLSLANLGAGSVVEVDRIALTDGAGNQGVQNGAFWQGGDHWLFTSDTYWPWHMENLFLHLLFEQGLFGLLLFLLLLGRVGALLLHADHVLALGLLAGLTGFLVTGLFSSLLDAPRFIFLFYLLALVALAAAGRWATDTRPA